MAHRADLNTLPAADRQAAVNLILAYLTDAVVANHISTNHSGEELFTGHRAYIAGLQSLPQTALGPLCPCLCGIRAILSRLNSIF